MQALIDWFHAHNIFHLDGQQWLFETFGLAGLIAVVFAETGLLVGFLLPGDSLLVTAGIFCTAANPLGKPVLDLTQVCVFVSLAAIVGDTVGYWVGAKAGPRLFTREESFFFSRKHLLRTRDFYERHGGKTIVLARFMPFIRTFAPVVAGVGQMRYRRFVAYNVFGGIGWVVGMACTGYLLASTWPGVTKHIEKLILLIIFLSLLPAMIGWLKARTAKAAA